MTEQFFSLSSFAKINWFLRVAGKRADGFHELCTAFQTVSLHDRLSFTENKNLVLTCDAPYIPTNEKNLIIKGARILQDRFGVERGAKVHLEKKIPAPGGLGGGSSNAAITLLGLVKLWEIPADFSEILEIARQIGSDVPFFLYGGTALGTGRGTEISPLPEIVENYLLIVTPPVNVSTAEAFAGLNAPSLTNENSKRILQICRQQSESLNLRQTDLINDFETSVFKVEPEIERVKQRLLRLGAIRALLSGSGASVYGIFDNKETRQTAEKALETEKKWRKFVVATVSRREYRAALQSCDGLLPISF